MTTEDPLLYVRGAAVSYRTRAGTVTAVDGVDLTVRRGEIVALVGESGCGKSSLGRAVLRLEPLVGGEVRFGGVDLGTLSGAPLRQVRRRLQMVFQDPQSSLDPRRTVGAIVERPLRVHRVGTPAQRREKVAMTLDLVGLGTRYLDRYPAALSGGQRQRVGIARALVLDPDLLVCDEPVSALDVSIQAQILELLLDLRERLGLALLFIAHDLAVVRHLADQVAVMYLGRIVERGSVDEMFARPRHPYTQALLSAAPVPDVAVERARTLPLATGDLPDPLSPPSGCAFRTRCPHARPVCAEVSPALVNDVACHRQDELPPFVSHASHTGG
ncbi:ABC transporter ATP-binding protein [Asanoa ishikariensis]|uniref:Peptide/nickel transport system ATP-binding protein/oligopeptide transport system ATP-binding protein n=1 Tax=Asanoa ishikariensis TaxID=137265 RepID=A0A1H3RVD5_9ACTN|nr:oligopeptide/dipeptide ABC transporter ATP-binding protein [Asanoa ishikariensis]GIF66812.1 ABC transporter ATP-binding protein [Asanoa ishikariensis]SDZ29275.1 peptide/nickel transport system ATP-binding protein/oligopeptide transport system ATP-binding protein [Asanoa ishikariensis]